MGSITKRQADESPINRKSTVPYALQQKSMQISWSNYGPAIVSECSKHASGSPPRRVISVSYQQMLRCHGIGFCLLTSRGVAKLSEFAKLRVNSVDRFLVEYAAHHVIQRMRRFQVTPEGLFQNDSRPPMVAAVQSSRSQTFNDGSGY